MITTPRLPFAWSRWAASLAAVLLATTSLAAHAAERDGQLDSTFGAAKNGKVSYTLSAGSASWGVGILQLKDSAGLQKIVLTGTVGSPSTAVIKRINNSTTPNSSTSADSTFGNNSEVLLQPAPATASAAYQTLALRKSGRGSLVVVGGATVGGAQQILIARLTSSGALDTTFNTTGYRMEMPVDGGTPLTAATLRRVVELPDGRVVAAGDGVDSASRKVWFAMRLFSSGNLDTTFGGGDGVTVLTAPFATTTGLALRGLALQADGKAVLGGSFINNGQAYYDMLLMRLNTDGTLDTTFDQDGTPNANDGTVTLVLGVSGNSRDDKLTDVLVAHDQKIIVTGGCWYSSTRERDGCVTRLNSAGSVDTTFGTAGTFYLSGGGSDNDDVINSVVQEPFSDKLMFSGKTTVTSAAYPYNNTAYFLGMRLLYATGALDTSFDNETGSTGDGVGRYSMSGSADEAMSVAQQDDGKFLLVGVSGNKFSLVRLTAVDGDGDGLFDSADPAPSGGTTDSDGDGHPDASDAFPNDPTEWQDTDLDGIGDNSDNCSSTYNPTQFDADNDGAGDACDGVNGDDDGDGVPNTSDNCPLVVNADQADLDSDAIGNACDDDRDGDGVVNAQDAYPDNAAEWQDTDGDGIGDNGDNCRAVVNADQTDMDSDGYGAACDGDDNNPNITRDDDKDGVDDSWDNCKGITNPDQHNIDGDAYGDACDTDTDGDGVVNTSDNCPLTANPDQADVDNDGAGAACDGDDNDPLVGYDTDGDGVTDNFPDNCPLVSNANQLDTDGDGDGDACDTDTDGDGVPNVSDNCPLTANPNQLDTDGNGVGDACAGYPPPNERDTDHDQVVDSLDNCPLTANPDQLDTDGDTVGDACDGDKDGDGVADATDNCPLVVNPAQTDADSDGYGAACDTDDTDPTKTGDIDGDLIDNLVDNCPYVANADQANLDGDAYGDACDNDTDADGVPNTSDNCPLVVNPAQTDADSDGYGAACDTDDTDPTKTGDIDGDTIDNLVDNCPYVANADQANLDGDAYGDACDNDKDGDGVPNTSDNCPLVVNADQADLDSDAIGNACDDDRDGDGVVNAQDAYPDNAAEWQDTDGDGIGDNGDNCRAVANNNQLDSDADGWGNACDGFPNDPTKVGDPDTDGLDTLVDNCPYVANVDQANMDGDSDGDVCDTDTDGDGVVNTSDNCPLVVNADQADLDSDAIGNVCDDDRDGDNIPNTEDAYPDDAAAWRDLDGDGLSDNADNCPAVANADQVDTDGDGIGDACDGLPDDPNLLAKLEGNISKAQVGSGKVLLSYDLDRDGRDEIIVGSPNATVQVVGTTGKLVNLTKAGTVIVYSPAQNAVLYSWVGSDKGDMYGNGIAITHDVDGDGFDDILIGAPMADAKAYEDGKEKVLRKNSGKIEVRSGRNGQLIMDMYGQEAGEQMGYAVAGLADDYDKAVSSDGKTHADLLVASPYANVNTVVDDRPVLFRQAGVVRVVSTFDNSTIMQWSGRAKGAHFGTTLLTGLGDPDGDGYENVLIGAPLMEYASVDKPMKQAGMISLFTHDTTPLLNLGGERALDQMGNASMLLYPDVTGDGKPELLVGMPYASVVDGSKVLRKAGRVSLIDLSNGEVISRLEGTAANQWFGASVARVPDLNGDGKDDILVGAPRVTVQTTTTDGKTVKLAKAGTATVFSGDKDADYPVLYTFSGGAKGDQLGSVVATGNYNGDSKADLAIGVPLADKTLPSVDGHKPQVLKDTGAILLESGKVVTP
jgi:uncharacterized delta-60 repeat protein